MKDKRLISHLIAEIEEIDAALKRIENGTYGICEKTGAMIAVERLKAHPMARTAVE